MRRIWVAALAAAVAYGAGGLLVASGAPGANAAQPPISEAPSTSGAPTNDISRTVMKAATVRSPSDTLGNGIYLAARLAFYEGDFTGAMTRAREFSKTYTRNLNMNDALELDLLLRGFRDFEDQPLCAYARTLALREAGSPDSAAVIASAALEHWPGAHLRYHLHYQLAELARDRGDAAAAVSHALAVADTSSHSRLAPAALKLAGDESITMGQGSDRALKLYQELLERFPDSPLAPSVRAHVLEMRKRLQL